MGNTLREKDLENLDKQTLITMLMMSNTSIAALQQTVEQLNKSIDLLTEEVAGLRQHRFGRSSEKGLAESPEYEQISFSFNEAEITIDLHPDPKEPEIEEICPAPYKRKKHKGKREEDFKDIPTTVVNHALTDEELLASFPDGKWKQLPDEVYKRLEFHPASFEVIEHHVAVYAGSDNETMVRAARPADLMRNCVATPSLVAGILNYKYVNAQPIARLSKEFENHDVRISSQNMCNWTIKCAERYISRLYERLRKELYSYHVIHADETPVLVNKDGRPAGSKSYMWVYRSGALEEHPFVLYDYQKTRKSDHPREFLKDFKGYCITDGYEVYHTIDRERDDLTFAGCWAHAHRGFSDVVKTMGEVKAKGTTAYKALQVIGTMFHYEDEFRKLSPEERLSRRQEKTAPIVDAFFAWMREESLRVAPKSQTGKAIAYCLNQEKYLRIFLTDGLVPMDNNAAERCIRTFCLGKKNWYTIDTISGAKASAILYSIAETAKANRLKPYEYFKLLLEEIPKHGENEDPSYLDDLLPWAGSLPECCRKMEAPVDKE
jgi:transposase